MKKLFIVTVLLSVLALTTVSAYAQMGTNRASAQMIDIDGNVVGTARITETSNGVLVEVNVSGVPAGSHGIHFHQTGTCDPAADPPFSTAGSHFNPTNAQHGLLNPAGPHAGDLPNFQVNSSDGAFYSTTTALVTLTTGDNALLDGDGTALIIHSDRDDQVTDPDGNSGSRIICSVIEGGDNTGFLSQPELEGFNAQMTTLPTGAVVSDVAFFTGFNEYEITFPAGDCALDVVYKLSPEGVLDKWNTVCISDDTLILPTEGDATFVFLTFDTAQGAADSPTRFVLDNMPVLGVSTAVPTMSAEATAEATAEAMATPVASPAATEEANG